MSADSEKHVERGAHTYARELLQPAKDRMPHYDREPVKFEPGDLVYLITKGPRIQQHSNRKLRDMQLALFGSPNVLETELMIHICHERSDSTMGSMWMFLRRANSSQPLQQTPLTLGRDVEDVEGEKFAVERISTVKVAPFVLKRGLWLEFLTYYSGYAQPEWSLLAGVNYI